MRQGAATLVLAAVLPATAQAQEARTRMLGEEWVGADGNRRIASVGVWIDRKDAAEPELIRRLEINWRAFPYQKGPFPVPLGEANARWDVPATLDIDDAGVPRDCRIDPAIRETAYRDHSCPFLLKYLRFHPALTRAGSHVGGTVRVWVKYTAGRIGSAAPIAVIPERGLPIAAPLMPIDAAAVGFSRSDGLPRHVGGVGGKLLVQPDGSVSACTLTNPTQVDRFDLAVCERLSAWRFAPATDHRRNPIAGEYQFSVERP